MELLIHTIEHAFIDCLRMLPFLFAAFLLMFRRKNTCGRDESGIK